MHKKDPNYFTYGFKTTSKTFSKLILFLFLSFSTLTFAQPGFDDDVNDEVTPAAPIDSSIVVLFFSGIALGYYLLKKDEKIKN